MRNIFRCTAAVSLLWTALAQCPFTTQAAPAIHTGFDVPAAMLKKMCPAASAFPNADTYWLRLEDTVTVHADGTVKEVFHDTAQIRSERGMDNADVSLPYDSLSQSVTDIRARTIRPDGTALPVQASDIHESSPNSDFTLYDDAKDVEFSLPGVEPGAIIDYQYTVLTHTPLRRGQYSDAWWLATTDPCRLNRYTLIVPATMTVRDRTHNAPAVKFTSRLSPDGRQRTLSWVSRNSPDITPEPSMPSEETYLPWLEVSTWPDWQSVAQWYQGLASPRTVSTPALTALVRRLTAGKTTERDKAQALFYWVEKRTRYVALEMGLSAYQPHAAATVFQNRYGDCKDMATLLITLLRAAGIRTAWPALLDTETRLPMRDHLAVPDTFDHAIVRADLDGKPYWFDATAELASFGDIPGDDRGVEAFVVRDGVGTFETIPQGGPDANRTVYQKTVTLHDDGSAECRTTVQGEGDSALSDREEFHELKPSQLAGHFQSMIGDQSCATLEKFSLSPCDDPGTPLTYGVTYHAPLWAVRTGKLLIVSDGFAFSTPTDLPKRRYPLSLDTSEQMDYTLRVQLPAGYVVEAQPDDINETMSAGHLRVTYTVADGCLTIHKVFTLIPATVSPSDYPRLRDAVERITRLLKQPVVLRPA